MSDERFLEIESRLRELERHRFVALAAINAYRTLLLGAWGVLALHSGDPVTFARRATEAWKEAARLPPQLSVGDPAYHELLSQEYQEYIEALAASLLAHVESEAAK